jgi:hypothetical protein
MAQDQDRCGLPDSSRRDSRSPEAIRVIRSKVNRRHMISAAGRLREQLCWSEPWTVSARTGRPALKALRTMPAQRVTISGIQVFLRAGAQRLRRRACRRR